MSFSKQGSGDNDSRPLQSLHPFNMFKNHRKHWYTFVNSAFILETMKVENFLFISFQVAYSNNKHIACLIDLSHANVKPYYI